MRKSLALGFIQLVLFFFLNCNASSVSTNTDTDYYPAGDLAPQGDEDYNQPIILPSAPQHLQAQGQVAHIALRWDAHTDTNIIGYNVYRTQTSGVEYVIIRNYELVTTNAYIDASVTAGATYYYVVTAITNTGLESHNSNEAFAMAVVPTYSYLFEDYLDLDMVDTDSMINVAWDSDTILQPTDEHVEHPPTEASQVLYLQCEQANNPGFNSVGPDAVCDACPTIQVGKIINSCDFNGSQAMDTIDSEIYTFNDTDTTWATWFKTEQDGPIIGGYCGYGHLVSHLRIQAGAMEFIVNSAGGDSYSVSSTSTNLNDGQWHHVAVTRTVQDGVLRMYIDGQSQAMTQGEAYGGDITCGQLAIGNGSIGGTSNGFIGQLDALLLASRALSAEEIVHLAEGTIVQGSFYSEEFVLSQPAYEIGLTIFESQQGRSNIEFSFDNTHWCFVNDDGIIFDETCLYPASSIWYRVSFADDTLLDGLSLQLNTSAKCIDYDFDGFGHHDTELSLCSGNDYDCDDQNPFIYPANSNPYCNCSTEDGIASTEVCDDGLDNDCNGAIDEKDPQCYNQGTIYYISNTWGDDANNGTSPQTPFKSMLMAQTLMNQTMQPGDKILFARNDTWSDASLVINASGTSENPITISSYGIGLRPHIHQTIDVNTFRFDGVSHVIFEDFHVTRSGKMVNATGMSFPASTPAQYVTIRNIHLQGLSYGIAYTSDYFLLENSIIEDCENSQIEGGGHSQGIFSAGSSNGIIRANQFHRNGKRVMFDHNIYFAGDSNNWLIENNVFTGSGGTSIVFHGTMNNMVIRGNVFRDNYDAAIDISDYSDTTLMEMRNFLVENNRFEDNAYGFWLLSPIDLTIRNNIFMHQKVGGLIKAGDASDHLTMGLLIENNTFYENPRGLFNYNSPHTIIFRNNLVQSSSNASTREMVYTHENVDIAAYNNMYDIPEFETASPYTVNDTNYTFTDFQSLGNESNSFIAQSQFENAPLFCERTPGFEQEVTVTVHSSYDRTILWGSMDFEHLSVYGGRRFDRVEIIGSSLGAESLDCDGDGVADQDYSECDALRVYAVENDSITLWNDIILTGNPTITMNIPFAPSTTERIYINDGSAYTIGDIVDVAIDEVAHQIIDIGSVAELGGLSGSFDYIEISPPVQLPVRTNSLICNWGVAHNNVKRNLTPVTGNAAIDAGYNVSMSYDYYFYPRPVDGNSDTIDGFDIGAIEKQ